MLPLGIGGLVWPRIARARGHLTHTVADRTPSTPSALTTAKPFEMVLPCRHVSRHDRARQDTPHR
eukprot:5718087-Prymnesium_polylepis.1